MATFKCKMCGGEMELPQGATVCTCEYCGTKQTLPKLDSEKRANLYDRANHFRRNNDFDKAMAIYESILNEDASDAEAYWSIVLCRYGIEYVEDPSSHKRIPTVNRAQFTSVLADEDYKSALKYSDTLQKTVYEAEAKAIDDIQKGILEISSREEPFDVFICYKETDANGRRTPDSVLANDLYHQLTQEGFKVFFSRITLEDKLGQEYEPYIFAALNSAKVMVALGTKPEYFNAVWVKNEWSRYLALIRSGKKKMLIPAFRDMDPYDLPEEFSHLQAQDMSKLGFMQDLIRGIKKILDADMTKPQTQQIKETVIVNSGATTSNENALIDRAFLALEDGEWQKADDFCEQALNQNAKNAYAYLGKLMAELQCHTEKELQEYDEPFDNLGSYQKALRFGNEELKNKLQTWNAQIRSGIEEYRLMDTYNNAMTMMQAARTESEFNSAANQFLGIKDYRDSFQLATKCLENAEICRQNGIYDIAMSAMQQNTENGYQKAIEYLSRISSWRDADEKIIQCKAAIDKIKEDNRLAAEHRRKTDIYETGKRYMLENTITSVTSAIKEFDRIPEWKDAWELRADCQKKLESLQQEEKERLIQEEIRKQERSVRRKKAKKRACVVLFILLIFAAAGFVYYKRVYIPNQKYQLAASFLANGQYKEAVEIYREIDFFKDSKQKIDDCEDKWREALYTKALSLYEKGSYNAAYDMFLSLEDYKDSEEKAVICAEIINDKYFAAAETLYNEKNFEEALVKFKQLESVSRYKDICADYITMCDDAIKYDADYIRACETYESGEYENAKAIFEKLTSYQNSADYIAKCDEQIAMQNSYSAAVTLFREEKYEDAAIAFAELGNYKDSPERTEESHKYAILESTYQNGLILSSEGKYEETIEVFGALNDYKDSAEKIEACKTAILDAQYQEAKDLYTDGKYEEAIEAFGALNGYKDSAALLSQIYRMLGDTSYEEHNYGKALGYYVLLAPTDDLKEVEYSLAQECYDSGCYEQAVRAYEILGDYELSNGKLPIARYAWADQLFNNHEFALAAEQFTILGSLSDSAARADESKYQLALKKISCGDNEGAKAFFIDLDGYRDSADMAKECDYRSAKDLMDAGIYESACKIFKALGTYSDSSVQLTECIYLRAEEKLAAEEYEDAANLYSSVQAYKDSGEKEKLCSYNIAEALFSAGQYDEAEMYYAGLKGYQESDTRYSECVYYRGNEAFSAKKYDEAIAILTGLNYKNSKEIVSDSHIYLGDGYLKNGNKYKAVNEYVLSDSEEAQEKIYQIGKDYATISSYEEAIETLFAAGDYAPAKLLLEELGDLLVLNGNKTLAYFAYAAVSNLEKTNSLFAEVSYEDLCQLTVQNISDTEDIVKFLQYSYAENLRDAGKYPEAYAIFSTLRRYKDVDSIIKNDKNISATARKAYLAQFAVGKSMLFGSYEQDNNKSNGKEPIEWQVLANDGKKALLISKYGLDCQQYNTKYTDITWADCTLRTWLNNEFYNAAFSTDEQKRIITSNVSADKNPEYSTDPGKATQDKVFLLSITEAEKYFSTDEARKCAPTAYAKAQGAYTSDSYKTADGAASCWWWLRSPGYSLSIAAGVYRGGSVDYYGYSVYYDNGCVRPTLWINLDS